MGGIDDRPQQAHRDRLDALGRQRAEQRGDLRRVERDMHAAVAEDALLDLEGQRLRHERLGIGNREVERLLPAALAKHQRVGMAGGGDEGGPGGAPGDDGVDGVGGAVDHDLGAAEIGLERLPRRLGRDSQRVEHAGGGIGRGGRRLVDGHRAVGMADDQVGKGAAGIDGEAEASRQRRSHGRAVRARHTWRRHRQGSSRRGVRRAYGSPPSPSRAPRRRPRPRSPAG